MTMPGEEPVGRPSTSQRARAYRERMRDQGLRLIQHWVPDVREPGFSAEAHRQSLAVASSPQDAADQEFIDAISAFPE